MFHLLLATAATVALDTIGRVQVPAPTRSPAPAPAAAAAASGKRAFEPRDWYRLRTLSSPVLSPEHQSTLQSRWEAADLQRPTTGPRQHLGCAHGSSRSDRPTELYLLDLATGQERQLTTFNKALNDEIAWSAHERFTYTSVADVEIEGWLLKPYGYQPGRKYPLVLYIHGGPHSAYTEGWFDEFQNLAAAGNPRGSSGYGGTFTYSTRERWGMED